MDGRYLIFNSFLHLGILVAWSTPSFASDLALSPSIGFAVSQRGGIEAFTSDLDIVGNQPYLFATQTPGTQSHHSFQIGQENKIASLRQQSADQGRKEGSSMRLSFVGFTPMLMKSAMCGNLSPGESISRIRYASSSGSPCTSEVQTSTCVSGAMTAYSGTYTFTSCTESRTRYAAASTNCPTACSAQQQTRTCTNGSCAGWSGTYAQTSCTQNQVTESTTRYVIDCWGFCTWSKKCVASGSKYRTCSASSNTVPGSWSNWSPADECSP